MQTQLVGLHLHGQCESATAMQAQMVAFASTWTCPTVHEDGYEGISIYMGSWQRSMQMQVAASASAWTVAPWHQPHVLVPCCASLNYHMNSWQMSMQMQMAASVAS
jgi:hypothetical protein